MTSVSGAPLMTSVSRAPLMTDNGPPLSGGPGRTAKGPADAIRTGPGRAYPAGPCAPSSSPALALAPAFFPSLPPLRGLLKPGGGDLLLAASGTKPAQGGGAGSAPTPLRGGPLTGGPAERDLLSLEAPFLCRSREASLRGLEGACAGRRGGPAPVRQTGRGTHTHTSGRRARPPKAVRPRQEPSDHTHTHTHTHTGTQAQTHTHTHTHTHTRTHTPAGRDKGPRTPTLAAAAVRDERYGYAMIRRYVMKGTRAHTHI